MKLRRFNVLLGLPGVIFLTLFFLTPSLFIFSYIFGTRTPTGKTAFDRIYFDSFRQLLEFDVFPIIIKSFNTAVIVTVICLLIGYPFAYQIRKFSNTMKYFSLFLISIPFLTNFLARTYAWKILVSKNGLLTRLLSIFTNVDSLLFTDFAVILGMVYVYLPFMILPIFSSLENIDDHLLESARDLYANPFKTFYYITFKLSLPGVIAGIVLTFIPSLGAYIIPQILGGSKAMYLGNFTVLQYIQASNWPLGSLVSLIILVFMGLAINVLFKFEGQKNL